MNWQQPYAVWTELSESVGRFRNLHIDIENRNVWKRDCGYIKCYIRYMNPKCKHILSTWLNFLTQKMTARKVERVMDRDRTGLCDWNEDKEGHREGQRDREKGNTQTKHNFLKLSFIWLEQWSDEWTHKHSNNTENSNDHTLTKQQQRTNSE